MIAYLTFLNGGFLAAALGRSNRLLLLFLLLSLVFVGFRHETGYDWPVYKDQFIAMSGIPISGIVGAVVDAQLQNQQDYGFLILSFVSSKIFPSYELFQAFLTAIFLYSFVHICRTFSANNVVLALAIANAYLLLTLEFSTVRQALALSLVLLGVSNYLRRNRFISVLFFAFSLSVQASSFFYIFCFGLALKSTNRIALATVLGVGFAGLLNLIFYSGIGLQFLPENILIKIEYYQNYNYEGGSLVVILFYALLCTMPIVACFLIVPNEDHVNRHSGILRKYIIYLALLGLAFFSQVTLLERISYLLFVLTSIYVCLPSNGEILVQYSLRLFLFVLGLSYSLNILLGTNSIAFDPYQNYLADTFFDWPSDGRARNEYLLEQLGSRRVN